MYLASATDVGGLVRWLKEISTRGCVFISPFLLSASSTAERSSSRVASGNNLANISIQRAAASEAFPPLCNVSLAHCRTAVTMSMCRMDGSPMRFLGARLDRVELCSGFSRFEAPREFMHRLSSVLIRCLRLDESQSRRDTVPTTWQPPMRQSLSTAVVSKTPALMFASERLDRIVQSPVGAA